MSAVFLAHFTVLLFDPFVLHNFLPAPLPLQKTSLGFNRVQLLYQYINLLKKYLKCQKNEFVLYAFIHV